ncbi:PGC-1 and ERR-induced regulator in muscle protein 1 [Mesocricetus auratus]|uniref:PGC-1 and ERR-induced regulator in muscle protein 1 n=1 Tax=Mesocricetus auratus TaxID=10036 RepID=A0A3Q0D5F3_MESAU|nr:PGC-1 and ERR-induced regulator in muscle protein 1 [Mesocricetus auratus]
MDNFQYSVQLSDREWAEFAATADECGLLQAGLASGDELLSSDIGSDIGSDSGSSPPRPPPLFTGQLAPQGRRQQGCELEDVTAQQLVSRSQCEPVLALDASHQVASTSTQSEALLFLGSDSVCPGQTLSFPGSTTFRDKMQRLLQGPAPSSSGEASHSPDPGHSAMPQSAPDNLETPLRNPGRKKRRGMGSKGGKCSGSLGSAAVQMSSPQLMETRPKEVLVSGTLISKDQQDKPQSDSAGASEHGSSIPGQMDRQEPAQSDSAGASEHGSSIPGQMDRQEPGLDLSTPVIITEEDTEQIRKTPRAVPHMISKPVQEAHPDVSMATPNVSLSTHASMPQPYMALSKPASKPQSDTDLSPHVSTSDMTLSTLAFKCQPNTNQSTPASDHDMDLFTPASMSQLDKAKFAPDHIPGLHEDLSAAGSEIKPEVYPSMPASVVMLCTDLPHSVSKTESEESVSIPAMPSLSPVSQAETAMVDTDMTVPLGGYFEKPVGQLSAGSSGYSSGEPCPGPVQAPKKKKVRFSMAVPSHEESGSGEPTSPPFLTPDWPPGPRTASGSRGGSAAWDAVAVGPRLPQPRILKHLPPPVSSVSAEPEPGSCYAVTLPEAYEFFFCDTIEEEDEDVEDEAAASQALDEVQWPDTCEFFFRDSRVQRSSSQRGHSPVPSPRAEAVAPVPPGDLVPISIPEVYEHFFTEEGFGNRQPPTTHIQPQTSELLGSEAYSKPVPVTADHLSLAIREAGELRSPFTSFTFSQNDMCLVFVAFATWAVRTSDLHAPDAWKTVLLANIGTISAIRYFRRQVGRGHNGRPRPSCNSSPSC